MLAKDLFRPQLVTVDTPSRSDKERLQALGLDLTEHAGHDYVEVVVHSPADLLELTRSKLSHDVRIPDLLGRTLEVMRLNRAYARSVKRSPMPSGRTGYRTLADYVYPARTLVAASLVELTRTPEWDVAVLRPTPIRRFSCPTVLPA